jgi:hypothetical protein
LEQDFFQYHFTHHIFHMDWPGTSPSGLCSK